MASTLADPSTAELLALERQARGQGTGLTAAMLGGCWLLQTVWPKGGQLPAAPASTLLRGLKARLEIEPQAGGGLLLSNAVAVGGLELRFRGQATLVGRRPLLAFQLERVELNLAGRVLWHRSLPPPELRRRPFFALIHRDTSGWLAARGRGGGLALWRLASPER